MGDDSNNVLRHSIILSYQSSCFDGSFSKSLRDPDDKTLTYGK